MRLIIILIITSKKIYPLLNLRKKEIIIQKYILVAAHHNTIKHLIFLHLPVLQENDRINFKAIVKTNKKVKIFFLPKIIIIL
jgi:hypothetical protein